MASGTIKAVVAKSDIADNLTTNDSTKVLSAKQGKLLNDHIANNVAELFWGQITTTDTEYSFNSGKSLGDYKLVFFTVFEGTGQPVAQGSTILTPSLAKSANYYVRCVEVDAYAELHNITNTKFYAKTTNPNNIQHRLLVVGIK